MPKWGNYDIFYHYFGVSSMLFTYMTYMSAPISFILGMIRYLVNHEYYTQFGSVAKGDNSDKFYYDFSVSSPFLRDVFYKFH